MAPIRRNSSAVIAEIISGKLRRGPGASESTRSVARENSSSSPAPNTREWLARICSSSEVPERGMPTMNTGVAAGSPPPLFSRISCGREHLLDARQGAERPALVVADLRALEPVALAQMRKRPLGQLEIRERLAEREVQRDLVVLGKRAKCPAPAAPEPAAADRPR